MKKKIAVSVGDLNGIGIELALRNHQEISRICTPIYCIDHTMLKQAADLLDLPIPDDFTTIEDIGEPFRIKAGTVDAASGSYSFSYQYPPRSCCEAKSTSVKHS